MDRNGLPSRLSRFAAWLPAGVRAAGRRIIFGRYDLPAIVARKSRIGRWSVATLRRLYYPRSLVSRQSRLSQWVAVHVQRELPTLYHFDIHLVDHCNLNCRGCAHFSTLCEPHFADLDAFAEDMDEISRRLHVERISLLGGEPLLHPRVSEFLGVARAAFPAASIRLVTNGTLLLRMSDEFWDAMAQANIVLIISAYPIPLQVDRIRDKAHKHGVELELTSEGGDFFKVPIDAAGQQSPRVSFTRCSGISNCPMYKDGRLYPCAYTAYADAFASRFGLNNVRVTDDDSISVRDATPLEIARFLSRPVPFCRFCDFDRFEQFQWGRSEGSLTEWTVDCDTAAK